MGRVTIPCIEKKCAVAVLSGRIFLYAEYFGVFTQPVLVTNGGYGTVTYALGAGVPLVVAGLSEDKPEVAARVTWSGAGIDLKTDCPTPKQVRDAIDEILAEPRYRNAARGLASEAECTTQSIPGLLAHIVNRRSKR